MVEEQGEQRAGGVKGDGRAGGAGSHRLYLPRWVVFHVKMGH